MSKKKSILEKKEKVFDLIKLVRAFKPLKKRPYFS